jgi:cyclopropane-fatty-acyl-phospholipid synthase
MAAWRTVLQPRGRRQVTTVALGRRPRAVARSLLQRAATRVVVAGAERIRDGHLTVVWPDASRRSFGDPAAERKAELRLHHPDALVRMLVGGETGAGEAYMDGLWSSPDLPALLKLASVNRDALALSTGWMRVPDQLRRTVAHRLRRNTRRQSRRNISEHYDLGNEFYRLWLDETMTYSSAVFASPTQTLADAQRNKYRLIAEAAGLQPGHHVLEIGTGWGGFAIHAAGELGCRVTSITLSHRQADLARERVAQAGLEGLVDIQLRDYRDIEGTYDAVVSIEMLEAVGAEYFAAYFRACSNALKPSGRMALQTITVPDVGYRRQVAGANWIQRYIFPGGLLPSLAAIERSLHGTGLVVASVRDVAADYVRTLSAWRTRFLERRGEVIAMGFDERFVRMWEYYLALSEAGFATGITQDLQIGLDKRLASA